MSKSLKPQPAVTLSLRIPSQIRDGLEELADATGRTKSFLASEAILQYLSTQAWQVKAIQQAVKKADSRKAQFTTHQKVIDWVNSLNAGDKSDLPK